MEYQPGIRFLSRSPCLKTPSRTTLKLSTDRRKKEPQMAGKADNPGREPGNPDHPGHPGHPPGPPNHPGPSVPPKVPPKHVG